MLENLSIHVQIWVALAWLNLGYLQWRSGQRE